MESYKHQIRLIKYIKTILDKKFATKEELEAIEKRVQEIVEDSVKFADESPYPDAEELFIDVYDQHDYPYIKED